jgi:hypothetical protein
VSVSDPASERRHVPKGKARSAAAASVSYVKFAWRPGADTSSCRGLSPRLVRLCALAAQLPAVDRSSLKELDTRAFVGSVSPKD